MDRKKIKMKYNGKCAYSGTPLEDDWQIDHIKPKYYFDIGLEKGNPNNVENLVPTQKLINHYKRAMDLERFREYLKTLHLRLAKLPKNPRTDKSKKRKEYLLKVAKYFDIQPNKPFSGVFYFEQIKN